MVGEQSVCVIFSNIKQMFVCLCLSRLESKREEGRREGGAFRSKLMRGLALTARTLPPIPPNGLLGWKDMPPAADSVTQTGLVYLCSRAKGHAKPACMNESDKHHPTD